LAWAAGNRGREGPLFRASRTTLPRTTLAFLTAAQVESCRSPLARRMVSISAPIPHAPREEPLSLLVVEDSPDDYELLMARLAAAGRRVRGVRVETAGDLAAALAAGEWSAVIADHRLPGFNSLEALALVRAHGRDLPFLIVSGAIGEEIAVDALRAGADDYLMKDNLVRLEPALLHAIEAAAARRAHREAADALAESERRFRALTANLPGMVFQLRSPPRGSGPSAVLVFASEGARRVLGTDPARLLADPRRWLAAFVPSDAAVLQALFERVEDDSPAPGPADIPRTAAVPRWMEYTAQLAPRPGDGLRFVEFTARARRLASGHWLWDGIAVDVTAQRRAEAALRASREELRELAAHQARAREEERASIAREVHDDIGSTLTGVKFHLARLQGRLAHENGFRQQLAQMDELVDAVMSSSTRIMHALRPGILDEGVVAALEWLARTFEARTGIACTFNCADEAIALDPDAAIAVFRIGQEALNNSAKHARPAVVSIRLAREDATLVLEVLDDGVGIAPEDLAKRGRFGLRGMRERALALGGEVDIGPAEGGGTRVTLRLPLGIGFAPAGSSAPETP
jgi:signal transduction histidine kinase